MSRRDPRLDGVEVRYGGRTLELRVYVNTDEAIERVVERVKRAVKAAPNSPMVVLTAGEVAPEDVEGLWGLAMRAAQEQVRRESGS